MLTPAPAYDFFHETIAMQEPTQDYSGTENDNDIVRGVQGTRGGWGYFGFAFFTENESTVKPWSATTVAAAWQPNASPDSEVLPLGYCRS